MGQEQLISGGLPTLSPGHHLVTDSRGRTGDLLTYGQVQKTLRAAGIVISKPKGLFRINFFSGAQKTERLVSTLEDALAEGLKLASTRKRPFW